MARVRVYLKTFNPDGTYVDDWVEVTKDVVAQQVGNIRLQLDVSEYDVGIFTNSGFALTLRNGHGLYSDVGESESIFYYKRSDTLVKVTWDNADHDYFAGISRSDDPLHYEQQVFIGLLSDEATKLQLRSQLIGFNVLGLDAIFERVIAPDWGSTPPANNLVSTLIQSICATVDAAISDTIFTVDNARIVPGNDVTFDVLTGFLNKSCKEVLRDLLTASNSVLYMDDTTPVVSARTASAAVVKSFYGPASVLAPENIIDLKDIRTGLNRTFNFVTWIDEANGYNDSAEDSSSVLQYTARTKNVTMEGITTQATRQAVIEAIKTEFANPKQELTLVTPMDYETLALGLLDRVDIDFPRVPVSASLLPIYGVAAYGEAEYPMVLSSFFIDSSTPFKVIGIELDMKRNQVSLALRRI
jgi:hypothetical protein